MTLTVGSLFSGVGGFDLGFERAGMEIRWQCEIDKAAREVLRRHWPNATLYEDVRNVGIGAASVDVVCGGFPCQDVSVAGRRAGLAGERSGLWFEFHRILSELAPEWVVIENVPGLLSSNDGRDFAVILRGLVELRYGVVWRVLDSQHFRVPQRRRRVFIVGHLGDGRAAEVLFEREGGAGDSVSGGETGTDIAAPVTARTHKGGFTDPVNDNVIAVRTLFQDSEYGIAEYDTAGSLRAGRIPEHQMVVDFRHTTLGDIAPTLQSKSQGGYSLNYTPGILSFEPRYYSGREGMAGAPNPLVGPLKSTDYKAGDSQQHVAGTTAPRRLTPLECERLQGFPDGWTAGQSDSARYKQMGNAVTVNVAEWIGRRIVAVTP
jgi:DNA (cytosine-5)-methyltransferase 1